MPHCLNSMLIMTMAREEALPTVTCMCSRIRCRRGFGPVTNPNLYQHFSSLY